MTTRARAVGLVVTAAAALTLAGCSTVPRSFGFVDMLSDHDAGIAITVAQKEAADTAPAHPGVPQPATAPDWPTYVTGVQAVAGLTRAAAEQYMDAGGTDETPVILVRLSGHFAAEHSGPPPASPTAPSNNVTDGTAIDLIVDASSGQVLDFAIGRAKDLPAPRHAQTLFAR